jgi:PKD repeat protein
MDILGCLGNINLLSLLWDFGDGNTSTLNDPTHNYNNVGTYKVNLYLTFNCYKDTISSILTINNINVNLKTN